MRAIIKIQLLVFISVALSSTSQTALSFKEQQLKNKRVKLAYDQKWTGLKTELAAKKINPDNIDVFIRVFKHEKELELWVKNTTDTKYTLIKKIKICASSGDLGPKRQEGDGQVPEGIYDIPFFNPASNYFLALKVGYPNKSDRILATGKPGGDIMIHGNCVTIGCIPLQDDPVKDVYILCVEAKNKNHAIRVELFPCKFTNENTKLLADYPDSKNAFWNNLKPAYTYFEENKIPVPYTIDKNGKYVYKNWHPSFTNLIKINLIKVITFTFILLW